MAWSQTPAPLLTSSTDLCAQTVPPTGSYTIAPTVVNTFSNLSPPDTANLQVRRASLLRLLILAVGQRRGEAGGDGGRTAAQFRGRWCHGGRLRLGLSPSLLVLRKYTCACCTSAFASARRSLVS